MYPYISPTGAGTTASKEVADRMEKLRADYIEACKRKDVEAQERIKDDERMLLMMVPNFEATKPTMPRVILITSYDDDAKPHHVYLDTHEVETLKVETKGMQTHRVFMKSGQMFVTNEDDFNRIERAMRERK